MNFTVVTKAIRDESMQVDDKINLPFPNSKPMGDYSLAAPKTPNPDF